MSKIQRAQHTCDPIANISGVWRCFSEVWCRGQLLCNYFFTIHNYCVTTSEIAKTTWVPKPRFSHVCVCVWGGVSWPPGLRSLVYATANFGHITANPSQRI